MKQNKIMNYLAKNKYLSTPRRMFGSLIVYLLTLKKTIFFNCAEIYPREFDTIIRIRRQVETLATISDCFNIFLFTKTTGKIPGDIAEVGVFKGGTARVICEFKSTKPLHLFDTYEGLPLPENCDAKRVHKGDYSAKLDLVKRNLNGCENVFFYKGLFPGTSGPVKDKKFSFVNLDVDLFKSTMDCLGFFYPRMNKGGVIISHDYVNMPGVKKAFDEFLKDKSGHLVFSLGNQRVVIKL